MTKIKNITLAFNCTEKLEQKSGDKFFCSKCAHHITDFASKSSEELEDSINKSARPVCGIFKRSQLSDQFLRYAAATVIATSALTIPAIGQMRERTEPSVDTPHKPVADDMILGIIIETTPEPVGGHQKFLTAINSNLKYPRGLTTKGKVFVEFTVDTAGRMKDIKLVKGFHEAADKEAVRMMTSLHYPFKPGQQDGKPVETKMVMPIIFDPEKKDKR
jgi:TonB family protein